MRKVICLMSSVCALGASLNISPAHAQDEPSSGATAASQAPADKRVVASSDAAVPESAGLEEVVVTAQRRGENLQRVPIAIATLSAESLQAKGVTSVLELTQATPNIYAAPFTISSSTLFFFMRGMGVGNPGQITADPSIGVYENGIYNPRPVPFVFDLLDPERVEILRGPQGTLYGRNTTGGAMNVVSRAPKGEFELRQLASYASRDQYRSITNLDLPAVGSVSFKGTLAVAGDDGFAKNIHDPSVAHTNDFGISKHVAGRVQARWQPRSDFFADYSFKGGREKTTGGLLQTPGLDGQEVIPGLPYKFIRDEAYRPVSLPYSETNIRDHGLTLEWKPMDSLTLRSITGVRHYDSHQFQDLLEAYGLPITVDFTNKSKVFTQELQAVGMTWEDRIKYAAGLYYFRENSSLDNTTDVMIPAFGLDLLQYALIDLHSVSKAAYAQVTVTPPILDDRFDLTLGGRYTDDRKEAFRDGTLNGASLGPRESGVVRSQRFNPAVTLAYRWSDTINSYAKFSTGYRAGGFDEAGPIGGFNQVFRPEDLDSYEIGLKSDLLDRRLRVNMAAFYNDFTDVQLPISSETDITKTVVRNIGQATIKGVEADISVAPSRNLTLNVNYAYLDTEVDEVRLGQGSPNVADLFVIPYAPKHSVSVSGDLAVWETAQGPLTLHADYTYKSSVFGSAGAGPAVPGRELYRAESQELVNGRISLARNWFDKPAQVSVFVKNALDSRHITWVSASGSQATSFFNQNFFLAAPRTIGVEVSFAL